MRRLLVVLIAMCLVGGLIASSVRRSRGSDLLRTSVRFGNYRTNSNRICLGSGWTTKSKATLLLIATDRPWRHQELVFLDSPASTPRFNKSGRLLEVSAGTPSLAPSPVSPNGRYVFEGSASNAEYVLHNIESGRKTRVPRYGGVLVWRSDSLQWLEYRSGSNNALSVHTVGQSPSATINRSLRGDEYVIWFDPEGKLVTNNSNRYKDVLDLRELSIHDPGHDRRFQFRLPSGSRFVNAALSPDGERVVWHIHEPPKSPSWPEALLYRLGWANPVAATEQDVLLISKPDGTEVRELGRVPAEDTDEAALSLLSWRPDLKTISIVHKGILYTKRL